MEIIDRGDEYVLNNSTKYLARAFQEARHGFGAPQGDVRSFIAESWRFPIVDSWADGVNFAQDYALNSVTFVYPVLPNTPTPPAALLVAKTPLPALLVTIRPLAEAPSSSVSPVALLT